VVDEAGRPLGIVSEGDLVRRLEDEGESRRSWWMELVASPEMRAEAYTRAHGRSARELMSSQLVTVEESTPVGEIARLLEERHIKRVPVLRDGRIVGIVSRADLLRALAVREPTPAVHADDRALRQALLAELDRAGLGRHPYVNIVVSDRVVHIWGFAGSAQEAQALATAARNVPGVADVHSHLAVRQMTQSA
jgi:signal-transduction protein with cAMP-binding, CBS, and nucleotidyltransferase domain